MIKQRKLKRSVYSSRRKPYISSASNFNSYNINTHQKILDKTKPFWKTLLKKLIKSAEKTTAHGLPRILTSKNNFFRIMWTLAVLAAFTYSTYTIIKYSENYFQYDVTTNIENYQESPIKFPAVTICNRITIDYFKFLAKFNYGIQFFEKHGYFKCLGRPITFFDIFECGESCNECFNASTASEAIYKFMDKTKRLIANEMLDENDKMKLGYLLDDMLISCEYNKKACNSSDFTHFWNNMYGNCYTFNSGSKTKILESNRIGIDFGLKMELSTR